MQPQNANSGVQLTFSSLADEKIKELQAIIDGITEPLILIDQNFDIKRVNQATLSFTNEAGYRDLTKQKCYTKLYGREIFVLTVLFFPIKWKIQIFQMYSI